MARNLRKFDTYNDYEAAELIKPAVSLVVSPRKVYYDPLSPTPPTPPTFDGKWKATYSDGNVTSAECDSSSAITNNEISLTNLVSVEIGYCVKNIDYIAFYNCSSLTSIDIPNSVTNIGVAAFQNCSSLTSIDIPNSVTSISVYSFRNCTSLTSCTIGNGVRFIDEYAFLGCNSLTSCTIGSGVTSISKSAFCNCKNLTSITINSPTPPTLGNYVFYNTNNCPIYVPSGSVSAYQSASGWSDYASRIQPIPNS